MLNAESRFLPVLSQLAAKFPNLRIILEHMTTEAAVETVAKLGPQVAGTTTAHHLHLIVDDWAGNPFNYCKPVAKTVADRKALLRAAVSGNPKFFFGSDSAPHPITSKVGGKGAAAGVFTQPLCTQLVVEAIFGAVESGVLHRDDVTLETLRGFLSDHGRNFYGLDVNSKERIQLVKCDEGNIDELVSKDGNTKIVPFRNGRTRWTLTWKDQ